MVEEMRQNLASTGTNASGRTSASLRVVMTDTGGQILEERSKVEQAERYRTISQASSANGLSTKG